MKRFVNMLGPIESTALPSVGFEFLEVRVSVSFEEGVGLDRERGRVEFHLGSALD
jgi:hypothetical protein